MKFRAANLLVHQKLAKASEVTCTGTNEYFGFGTPCDNECAKLSKQNQTNCPFVNVKRTEMCYCEEGYARDVNKTCIPFDKCPKNCDQDDENNNEDNDNGVQKFTEGNVDFTESFIYVASQLDPEVSAIYSPFSLLFLLAQLALYASGTSLDELLSVLNISKSSIRSTIPYYLTELNSQENATFSLAERIYASIEFKLNPCFEKDTRDIFFAEAQNVNFSNPTEAADIINQWVANKTNNLITDLVPPDSLSRNTIVVLVNAIYFKGTWEKLFKTENTKKGDFYVNENKNVTVNMMNQIESFKYADIPSQGVQVIELPYVNSNFSYLVLLPKLKDGLSKVLEQLRNKTNSVLQDAISKLELNRVNLFLPTIDTTTTTDLKDVLQKLNVSAIFDSSTANLNSISDDPTIKPFVTSALQKATITVNEFGSEAAAGTAIVVGVTSAQPAPSIEFNADHPFVYFILYKGTPIFGGIFAG
ncbi:unnamed protein product, partial [Brenthis ino]